MDNFQHSCSCAVKAQLPSDVYIYFALNLLVLSYALSRKHSLDVAEPSKVTTGVASNIHAQISSPWAGLQSAAVEILNDFFDSASRKATLVYDSIAKPLSTRRTSTIVAVGFMAGLMCASMLVSLLGFEGHFESVSTLVKDTVRFALIAHVETMLRLINWLRPAGRPSLFNEFWPQPGYIGYNSDGSEVAYGCTEAPSTSFLRDDYPSNATSCYSNNTSYSSANVTNFENAPTPAGTTELNSSLGMRGLAPVGVVVLGVIFTSYGNPTFMQEGKRFALVVIVLAISVFVSQMEQGVLDKQKEQREEQGQWVKQATNFGFGRTIHRSLHGARAIRFLRRDIVVSKVLHWDLGELQLTAIGQEDGQTGKYSTKRGTSPLTNVEVPY
ncbi:unnamed protein product [Zymoseptoria tritici ST99CH_3D1]|nr:unnamed protein product [Zymoseptoria tritici ST99CH_3D1]